MVVAQENINLHFDKNFYVLGETIRYNAYLTAESPTASKATMLRVELVDKAGSIQQQQRLVIEAGSVSGTMTIPLDWKEGWYTFHAYTVWNPKPTIKNSTTVNIPIYDDFKEHEENSIANDSPANFKANLTGTVKTNQQRYGKRGMVKVEIAVPTSGKTAIVSVAVLSKEMKAATADLQGIQTEFTTSEAQKPEALNTFYGQVNLAENDRKPLGIGVHYSMDNAVQWTAADENGVFSTTNRLGMNQSAQIFGLFNNQNKTFTGPLATQTLNFTDALSTKYRLTEKLPFNESIKKYLAQSQQRKKYREIFGLEKAVLASIENVEKLSFQPNVAYDVAEYASMTSLEEFLVEVVPFVKIKTKKGKPSVRMFDESKQFTNSNPVYLVDGWLTFDQESVLNIPITEVATIGIYRTTNTLKSQFGILGNEGVVEIKTKPNAAVKIKETLTNISPAQGIKKAIPFSTSKATFNKLPDFRPLIYWKGEVTLKDGKATISFPHSDDLGEFSIIVKGMTAEGELIEGNGAYEVK